MIYLLHFERPINPDRPAQHYLGYAVNLEARLAEHESGHGANLTRHALQRGIRWELARIWQGERDTEKYLKEAYRNGRKLCPICDPLAVDRCADLEVAPVVQRYRTGRVKIAASVAAFLNQRRWIFSADSIAKTLNKSLGPDEPRFTADQVNNALAGKTISRRYAIERRRWGWLYITRIDGHGN